MPNTTPPRLIINADDLGMSKGVVDSILTLASRGVVTSTTLMATGAAFDYAIEKLTNQKDMRNFSVGIHLDATSGTPRLSPTDTPSLVGPNGRFLPRNEPGSTRSIHPNELYLEFKAQIERVLAAGIQPSHLDNHYSWVYFDSRLFEVVARLASQYSLPIRFPFANLSATRSATIAAKLGVPEADFTQSASEAQNLVSHYRVSTPDFFWIEFTALDRTHAGLKNLIANLPRGIHELCVHPGTDSERQLAEFGILSQLDADQLRSLNPGMELVSYSSVGRKG